MHYVPKSMQVKEAGVVLFAVDKQQNDRKARMSLQKGSCSHHGVGQMVPRRDQGEAELDRLRANFLSGD